MLHLIPVEKTEIYNDIGVKQSNPPHHVFLFFLTVGVCPRLGVTAVSLSSLVI